MSIVETVGVYQEALPPLNHQPRGQVMLTYTKVRPVLHVEVTASVLKPDLCLRRKIVGDSREAWEKMDVLKLHLSY